ncbi:sensor histidine kinase [Saccharibacillus sp. CPCC 101409]|uniref:sensor histidine kinase n=1 Tax=Saccharibacillus sp. CPCC 101409 TaxID=3058041 RepID=UPI00267197EE|nr:sensor histidine kinase [Saccharibacillus sp. CPCC 101409]MDO3412525.1 sensor histidine kinase [Saccharibacillus sp. CPCC 101409]
MTLHAKSRGVRKGMPGIQLLKSRIGSMKLRHKLFISYLAVVLVPFAILGVYSYQQSEKLQLRQAEAVLQDNLNKIDDSLSYKLQRFNSAIELISYNPNFSHIFNEDYESYYAMYADLKETVDPLLNTASFLNSDIERIVIYTENNLTERVNSIRPISLVENEDWYREAMETLDTEWHIENGRVFGVRRIFGDLHVDKRNLVVVELVPGFLPDSLNLEGIDGAEIAITDRQDNVVYRAEKPKRANGADLSVLRERPADVRLNRGMREADWTLSLIVPADALTVSPWRIVRTTLVIEGIGLAVLLLIISLFSRIFVRRIQRLNRKMKLVEEGMLAVDLKVRAGDEIGELEYRFVKMLASLNRLIEEGYKSTITQREAELRALQAQINPHFLYNSLSVINWKAVEAGEEEISRVAGILSSFYRTTLNRGRDRIPVKDELLNTESYLEMQLIMHDYNFDAEYEIDDEIREMEMIKLVLQPIVENAIEHGIDQKRSGRGRLKIGGHIDSARGVLAFTVEDNGPGIEPGMEEEILVKQSKGYGLRNVQERIRIQYGEPYGISITGRPGEWTKVTVTLPASQ